MSREAYVRGLLVRAVEERGEDYVYSAPDEIANPGESSCFYQHPDGPGCIIGLILSYHGVKTQPQDEGKIAADVVRKYTDWPEYIASALTVVQDAQDHGNTWKVSVEYFDKAMGA